MHFWQDDDRAVLWLVDAGLLDGEVEAESSHYMLAWLDAEESGSSPTATGA